ncbi:unnamed protein product [Caenorhabditis brenneri]
MIASVIPIYVIVLCNMSHILLAIFFFPSIVEFLDELHWGFTHRSWFIEYVEETQFDWKMKRYINHSKESILMDKADLYEKCSAGIRKGFVNYYVDCDPDFEEYLRFRETRKTLQQAADDAVLVRKQNFHPRILERMTASKKLGKL